MKSKIRKLITVALATTMLLGMTLTANAAGCNWRQVDSSAYCSSCGHSCAVYQCTASGHYHYKCAHNHVR